MFINYITLMLVNLAAGLFQAGYFIHLQPQTEKKKSFVAGFFITGLIAVITGSMITFAWPIPGNYNIAFGEPYILFGLVFLGTALCLLNEWGMHSMNVFTFISGVIAIVIGARILNLGMTLFPPIAATGYFTAGGGAIFASLFNCRESNKTIKQLSVFLLLTSALIWMFVACMGYWGHLEEYSKWMMK